MSILSKKHYDFLVVGAGITGATFANLAHAAGCSVLVIDKREHIAGNVYTKEEHGIQVHKYGAHIFHTSDPTVWAFVNRFAEFNNYINSPIANYKGELYNLPFNMNTFSKMWPDVVKPEEARAKIAAQVNAEKIKEPSNLEEQALSLVGRDIFEKLVKGYTEKQWGRECKALPSSIINRLPCRFIYDNNYFNDRWQGIPIGGYTKMVSKMLEGIEVLVSTEYKNFLCENSGISLGRIIYCGPIDEYYGYRLGRLEYRSLRFEEETLETDDYQGVAVMNYTDRETPYTRIIEHKHFDEGSGDPGITVITKEYPEPWSRANEPYYTVNNESNNRIYSDYKALAEGEGKVVFAGRLGAYKYYDMDKAIAEAMKLAETELSALRVK